MAENASFRAMDTVVRKHWTQGEFFAWAQTQDTRYEFDGFEPIAMTGGDLDHDAVMHGLNDALRARLGPSRQSPFKLRGPDAGVQTRGKTVRYPDRLITRTKGDGKSHLTPGVIVIFEVVSPSSRHLDYEVKLDEYHDVPTVRRYVLLESGRIAVTVFERDHSGEELRPVNHPDDGILRLPEIGIEVPIAEIYEDVAFSGEHGGGN